MCQDILTLFFQTPKLIEFTSTFGELYLQIRSIENNICDRFYATILNELSHIQPIAELCALLDCMQAMAKVADDFNWTKPDIVNEKKGFYISEGRHILVEKDASKFVANDTRMSVTDKNLISILQAPNASGKSVYLKQVALIAYMAQIGCFVPAAHVQMGIFDAIYSRIYSYESVHSGTSAFLNELQQISRAIMQSSVNSLLLIDEFGKGTNIAEGTALLASCIEIFCEWGELAPLTLVSTHYMNIYDYLRKRDFVKLKTFQTIKTDIGIKSTFKLIDGKQPSNYATECAEVKDTLDFIMDRENESSNG